MKTTASKKTAASKPEKNPLNDLFIDELKDIYWAEKHLTKALPKMAKKATNKELKAAFEDHLKVTEKQIDRLEKVFAIFDTKVAGKKCEAMAGLVKEGEEMMKEMKDSPALDAAMISSAQKIEHYEMASYGCLRTFAKALGSKEAADLLQATLDEEGDTDKLLTKIAVTCSNIKAEQEN